MAARQMDAASVSVVPYLIAGIGCQVTIEARRNDYVNDSLSRIGKKKKPFYRVVVMRRPGRAWRVVELVGTYDPLRSPRS